MGGPYHRRSDLVQGYYQWTVGSTSRPPLDQAGAVQTATVTLLLPVDRPGRDRPQVAAVRRDARLAGGRWSDAIIGCRLVLELAGLTGGRPTPIHRGGRPFGRHSPTAAGGGAGSKLPPLLNRITHTVSFPGCRHDRRAGLA